MTFSIFIITLIVGMVAGFAISNVVRYWTQRDTSKVDDEIQKIECADCDMPHLMEEWKATIDTQMHFNDLIIKFRSIVLSVVIGISTITLALYKNFGFTKEILGVILIGIFFFWICCFLLDYAYYHQLLIGSVKHAQKFDENEYFKKKGLFGLTSRISAQIKHYHSNALIIFVYLVPMVLLLFYIIWKTDASETVSYIFECLKNKK